MANLVEKLVTPQFYKTQWNGFLTSATNYYRPMFRAGSVTPLWHIMIATSVVMYSATYISSKGAKVQARREIEKKALAEYYEKHGGGDGH